MSVSEFKVVASTVKIFQSCDKKNETSTTGSWENKRNTKKSKALAKRSISKGIVQPAQNEERQKVGCSGKRSGNGCFRMQMYFSSLLCCYLSASAYPELYFSIFPIFCMQSSFPFFFSNFWRATSRFGLNGKRGFPIVSNVSNGFQLVPRHLKELLVNWYAICTQWESRGRIRWGPFSHFPKAEAMGIVIVQ